MAGQTDCQQRKSLQVQLLKLRPRTFFCRNGLDVSQTLLQDGLQHIYLDPIVKH